MSVLDGPLAFVDIETTGGSHFTSRVLEVGVVRVEQNRVVASYRSLVNPNEDIPPFITGLTGITNEDVTNAPSFAGISDELAEVLDGAVFVAHNVRFDWSFLKMEFERLGANFRPQLLCTVRLSRRLFPQFRTHKLADLIERHQLNAPARHRAYDDAHCLWQFYQLCLGEFDLDTIDEAIKSQLTVQSVPSQLDRNQVDALPDGPGVYVFEDEDGAPLYVGKSVSVRKRVLSHFTSDYERGTEQKLAAQVKKLRGIPTHGELSALILESDMVKDLQPMYNRVLRRRSQVTMITSAVNADGYATVSIQDTKNIEPEDACRLLATYTTATRARQGLHSLAMRYRLCPKLLGLEKTDRACFQSQLGKCDRACEGVEPTEEYNKRFDTAFERARVAAWPFRGPVLVSEQYPGLDGSNGFIVDNWCVMARMTERDGEVQTAVEPHRFDLDRYKIMKRYLEDPQNRRRITPLSGAQMKQLVAQAA
jgi:DNA polymerase-3 subunit epsilon